MVQPIGPLMIEHRLIERMISVMKKKTEMMEQTGVADVDFIEAAVDFIKTYADRCHHGKEEDILFRDLKKKKMDPEDRKVMEELIQEHVKGRELTGSLVVAKERYASGDKAALIAILDILKQLVDFYPKHIEKEDKVFFRPSMEYLTKAERGKMLEEEYELDREIIHRIYEDKVDEYEKE
ncbi:cation-binding protein [Candidatus Thorarchaeota archaeon]|nr:MAG: cation-binding protein [Candidatus Thorarchaeota archaeon]